MTTKVVRLMDMSDDGVELQATLDSQWPAHQAIGDHLHRAGYQAILVASAARPEHRNLVVFRDTRQIAGCMPQLPPIPITDAPPAPRGMRT